MLLCKAPTFPHRSPSLPPTILDPDMISPPSPK